FSSKIELLLKLIPKSRLGASGGILKSTDLTPLRYLKLARISNGDTINSVGSSGSAMRSQQIYTIASDSPVKRYHNEAIVHLYCHFGSSACQSGAWDRFRQYPGFLWPPIAAGTGAR